MKKSQRVWRTKPCLFERIYWRLVLIKNPLEKGGGRKSKNDQDNNEGSLHRYAGDPL